MVLTNQSDSVFRCVGASGFPNQIETAEEYLLSTKNWDEAVELAGCPEWHEACLSNRVRQGSPQPSWLQEPGEPPWLRLCSRAQCVKSSRPGVRGREEQPCRPLTIANNHRPRSRFMAL